MDSRTKIRRTLDALFGQGAGAALPGDAGITAYRRNGRPRAARLGGTLLCTLRTDGGIAVTPRFAQMLLGRGRFRQSCVEVDAESRPFVERGRSVFCGHVEWCGSDVAVGAEAAALFGGRVIAVGRAALPAAAIRSARSGVAVRIRDSLKGGWEAQGPDEGQPRRAAHDGQDGPERQEGR